MRISLRFIVVLSGLLAPLTFAFAASSEPGAPQLPPDSIVATTQLGPMARGPAVDPATGNVYVAGLGTGKVSVLDSSGVILAEIPTPSRVQGWGPESIAVDTTKRIFARDTTGDLTIIDGTTNTVVDRVQISATGMWPSSKSVTIDRSLRRLYLTIADERKLIVLDADTLKDGLELPVNRLPWLCGCR